MEYRKTEELLQLEKLPDVVAFEERKRDRQTKDARIAHHRHACKRREKQVKALRHKVTLAMTRGVTSYKAIAKDLEVSPAMVKTVVEDKSFDKNLTNYQKGVLSAARQHLTDKAERAAIKLCEIIEKGTPQQKIQLEAIKDLLDRIGMKPHEVKETLHRQYTNEELSSMLNITKEVETITERLRAKDTPYLIDKPKKENEKAPSGPVTPS